MAAKKRMTRVGQGFTALRRAFGASLTNSGLAQECIHENNDLLRPMHIASRPRCGALAKPPGQPIESSGLAAGDAPSPPIPLFALALLIAAQILAMSVWFATAAALPGMAQEAKVAPQALAYLTSAVQLGFVVGALGLAASGLADRFDPRKVFALCALIAAASTAIILVLPTNETQAGQLARFAARFLTGAALAGVYPIGMKIAVAWSVARRGLLVGCIVGALTLGSALPHAVRLAGGTDWRFVILVTASSATAAAFLIAFVPLGPFYRPGRKLDWNVIPIFLRDRQIRWIFGGYLGHMWELYAFWTWIGVAMQAAFRAQGMAETMARDAASITAFTAIGLGGLACAPAGWLADRIGKARLAQAAMIGSAVLGLFCALMFNHHPTFLVAGVILWGIWIIPDSAQFSALAADRVPADRAGSVLTLQTALGFALTAASVQVAPFLASLVGWAPLLALLALGPMMGALWMQALITHERAAPGDQSHQ